MTIARQAGSTRVSRRAFFAAAGHIGLAAGAFAALSPRRGFAQDTAEAGARIVRSRRPTDFETPVEFLDSFITPVEHFYVRSHLPAPVVDPTTWRLQVAGAITSSISLSLDEVRRMPSAELAVTLECAGNGRAFFDPPVAGIQWGKGAVGTARWRGVRLADVLRRAGVLDSGRFVLMNGADNPLGTMPDFVRQLPMSRAMHPDTLLAYEMNGAPLPRLHGFPLRVIVPGFEGAYAVKWLTNLRVLEREFDGFWVATAYRYPVRAVAPGAGVAVADTEPLTSLVVKSMITRPLHKSMVATGVVRIAGFAWAGDTGIRRVDVSTDLGRTWREARLTGESAKYAWRRFETEFDAARAESYLVMSRATDAQGRMQPAVQRWNPSGYLWNVVDSVQVDVKA